MYFISLFADVNFTKFGPPVMEEDSRRGKGLSLQVRCGEGRVGNERLVKGESFFFYGFPVRLFSSNVYFCCFLGRGWFCKSANCEDMVFR